MRNPNKLFDFKAFGQAIEKARESKEWMWKVLAEKMNLALLDSNQYTLAQSSYFQ